MDIEEPRRGMLYVGIVAPECDWSRDLIQENITVGRYQEGRTVSCLARQTVKICASSVGGRRSVVRGKIRLQTPGSDSASRTVFIASSSKTNEQRVVNRDTGEARGCLQNTKVF